MSFASTAINWKLDEELPEATEVHSTPKNY